MTMIYRNNFIVFVLSFFISIILYSSHVLLPFMFGPIIAAIICVKVLKLDIKWPFLLSELGIVLLGVQIGSTFTKNVVMDIKDNWLSIIVVSISILLIALVMAFIFKKIARINTETAILSVIPGALTQMLVMAEQDKRANLLVVSLTQTSRIIFVVVLVPFISYFFHDGNMHANGKLTKVLPLSQVLNIGQIVILAIAIFIVYLIMSKIKFPTFQLLAPLIVLIVWNFSTGLTFTLAIAITIQNIMLIIGALIMVYVIHFFDNNPINELFLGAAPGGVNQIVLVALATGADVAMITSYHIFRIFFILFIIAPGINFFLKYRSNKRED
ncbi:AbrB family transcriptional regulator [Staphylococcus aureus]|uniref:AbrB family transcriptional regulator n=1 Tax=Staphylococcus aureus TaxID=1280 RepID=UPI001CECE385|nr:AbrB family transcriptional regulator [Staphylococcus aureus]UCK36508.1 AbrB family transcriptional regulator [Staphylococcus aureus]UCK37183.1 AbrB family transcriptional regulator [Staphylococcus aureus]UCK39557.1 AbrB family transcriptional regulator [Staphylococcus aureus]UCK43641.1 AbrB family transcriptional regulator [Staphylococcus aureus]UCK45854.1 AbrB family transcriptional regulator [Staphylococcus aureus]